MPEPNSQNISSMQVAVTVSFVRGCARCVAVAEGAGVAAIRDPTVTSLVLRPGKVHAHPVEAQQGAIPASPAASQDQPVLFAGAEQRSDTNGFDPDL